MSNFTVDRRQMLKWLSLSTPPLLYLAGCGGARTSTALKQDPGSADATSLQSLTATQQFACDAGASCKPLVEYLNYPADSLTPTVSDLGAALYDLTTVPDRFGQSALCYEFNGKSSLALVSDIANFPQETLAISFWAKSSTAVRSQIIALARGASLFMAVEFNSGCGLGVYWGQFFAYNVTAGRPGDYTDGVWHHFLVQYDGGNVSIFVDGGRRGISPVSNLALAGDATNGTAVTMYVGGGPKLGYAGAIDDVHLHNRSFLPAAVPPMVFSWAQIEPTNRNDSLIVYLPFNGDATNETGRGFNGTTFNVTPATDRFGQAGRAFAFDGIDSYVQLPQALGPFNSDICLAFWMQSTNGTVMTAYSVTRGITVGSADLNFVVNGGHALSVKMDGATSNAISFGAPGDLTDGAWHFVLLQLVGTTYQLWVDAKIMGTMQDPDALLTSDSVIRIGRASGSALGAANFWMGSLDDVQLYNTSFAPVEIANLMQMQFRPRDGAGLLAFQNKMWLLGGWNPADPVPTNSQVWNSSDGANWSFIGNAPWEGRHLAGWLVYQDQLWVVGGDKNSGHYQNQVWSSPDGLNWTEQTTTVPWADRATQYTVVFDNKMWLMGGQQLGSDTVPGAAYNDVYSSVDGKSWSLVAPHAGWSPRGQIIGNVVFAGKMWVIGGGTYDVRTYLNDIWSSVDGIEWDVVSTGAPWVARQFHNVAVFANKIWVIAGGTAAAEGGTTDVWYSSDGVYWTQLPNTPWSARHAASVLAFQNALWLACGSDSAAYNDVWKLTYAT